LGHNRLASACNTLEGHFAIHDDFGIGVRTIQRTVRAIANARSAGGLPGVLHLQRDGR
jgi:hypothetical protein